MTKIFEDQKLEDAAEDTKPPDMSVEANDLTIEDEVNLEPKKPGIPSYGAHKFTSTFQLGFTFLRLTLSMVNNGMVYTGRPWIIWEK